MILIQPLSGHHDRAAFVCGNEVLDRWLREVATQHQRKRISTTFVAVDNDALDRILGYYALTVCEVVTTALPAQIAKGKPRSVPGVRLGRLAIALPFQGQGLGELLLMNALGRTRTVAENAAVAALFVDAIDEQAARFYARYGFRAFPEQPLTLVLPL